MAKYELGELSKWADKKIKILDLTASKAIEIAVGTVDIVPGINQGGSRILGTIPYDTTNLAESLESRLIGSTSLTAQGSNSFKAIANAIKAGDRASFVWGGRAAPYVRHVHDGARGVAGTHWIDRIQMNWPSATKQALAEAKREVG